MNEKELEGSIVLEKLAEIGKVDEFLEAVDSDNLSEARALMQETDLDSTTIALVLKRIADADGEH